MNSPYDMYAAIYSMYYAVLSLTNEINANPNILPGINLRVRAIQTVNTANPYNSQGSSLTAILGSLNGLNPLVGGRGVNGLIGEPNSATNLGLNGAANVPLGALSASVANVPYCSPIANQPFLTDRSVYPTFFRTMPDTGYVGAAIAEFMYSMGWRRMGLIVTVSRTPPLNDHIAIVWIS
ncbi:periplasmic binding protein-like I, partial [Polychytrium aggregatum]|uniref:periplasmic binding protein-like I n=1 Tax=Polychytrium aggregatum TaxID=110093 RepID=UPI0022FE7BF8